ncbi:hypothetical protein NK718_09425 [Alsobacter sp. SYSU M60028]|uniref:Cache domain-containing protein n=1 Tax=Alsobacter ponti TaxID=2962936 RepID=A0ABT1LES8_9HYPH|nr:hypothetical protein [Alsobacter ponti]MCP8938733.1 hypothetical protein [Alsobacter ponti]
MSAIAFSPPTARAARATPVRTVLKTIAVLLVLAIVTVVATAFVRAAHRRAEMERLIADRAAYASRNFDDWVRAQLQLLQVLGTATLGQADNPVALRRAAAAALGATRAWDSVSILDANGRILAEAAPVPTAGPRRSPCPDELARALRGDVVVCTPPGSEAAPWDVAIVLTVAVAADAAAPTLVSAVVPFTRVQEQLASQGTPVTDAIESVVSDSGVVLARIPDPLRWIGRRPTSSYLDRLGDRSAGVFRASTLDGREVVVAAHRSAVTGWTRNVAVGIEDVPGWSTERGWVLARLAFLIAPLVVCLLGLRRLSDDA